ncbi:MAG: carbamoyltransferase HypF [Pirellulales bacterium]
MTTLPRTIAGLPIIARRFMLRGRVQGLGVRPTIFRLANELHLAGQVQNTSRGVEIDVEGNVDLIDRFGHELPKALPVGSDLEEMTQQSIDPIGADQFAILHEPCNGPLTARLPTDLSVCSKCRSEIANRDNRRWRYPMTSCTACGPRWSIIRGMPYERPDTTMAQFALCGLCLEEYESPQNRRFHAQTNACCECGPRVWSIDSIDGDNIDGDWDRGKRADGDQAIQNAALALLAGRIVAIKGLGGYQLLVDATNEGAVRQLRERKGRREKPFAVMVEDLSMADRLAWLDDTERNVLTDSSGPILLLTPRENSSLAVGIHPGLNTVGLMLPTTPLHALLAADLARPLVCTSGNREGDPLEYTIAGAQENLQDMCDLWLHHNRPIERPIDDSVIRVIANRPVTIRLARGLAPLALELPDCQPLLATGGHLKGAIAWSNGVQAVLGPHLGDLEGLAARERYLQQDEDVRQLYRFTPKSVVHDLHPDYFTTQWATRSSSTWGKAQSRKAVQHHHAHVVAGMVEHHLLEQTVLGISWDGTGYGSDGTLWGGEFLLATATIFKRVAHLRPFCLPGGEAAIREPWRVALALTIGQLDDGNDLVWPGVTSQRQALVEGIINNSDFSPVTTSAGRLFDGAAAIILGIERAGFDGQPAMLLEAAVDLNDDGYYNFPLVGKKMKQLDWRPLIAGLLTDRDAGVDAGVLSQRFHRTLAKGIAEVCRSWPHLPHLLTGGVFQNKRLTELVVEELQDGPSLLGLPGKIPPGDGGLAAGQLAFAASHEKQANNRCV